MTETVGRQLKQAREAKNLTIEKVVQGTHIRARYIEAIEVDDFESMPSPIQARAFLRLYAGFLGISLEDVISRQHDAVMGVSPITKNISPSQTQMLDSKNTRSKIPVESESLKEIDYKNWIQILISKIIHRSKLQPQPEGTASTFESEVPNGKKHVEDILLQPDKEVPTQNNLPSQLIFNEIGNKLQQRRDSLSLTLDEIERHTRVRKHYLLALEAGELEGLPSSVQAKGMLSNYARFLNMDVDEILLLFADGLQTRLQERQTKSVEESYKLNAKFFGIKNLQITNNIRRFLQRYISVDMIVGGGLVVLLLTFAIWGTGRVINFRSGSTPQPTAPPILSVLNITTELVTVTPEPFPTGNGASTGVAVAVETFSVTLPAAGNGAVQVVVIAQNEAYVRVTVDGKIQFEGRVIAGAAYPYDGNVQIEILTGNGRAISILYNQNNMGPMGDVGEVVDRIYTSNAILNPTATYTPTLTITPTPTITLRPSATTRPSVTPRSGNTPRPSQTPEE
jgi:cytoskeleton protein RodZ